ncbi:heparinase II/III family protein [candidate division KSB1 bacterium]|nr:heparinase II/III family protein [candidate division KSB1 bacterium]
MKDHPRVLLDQADVNRITTKIFSKESARQDFQIFLGDKDFIETPVECAATTLHLHRILNKVMKNSFLYMLGARDNRIAEFNDYGDDPDLYMRNIEKELLFLIHPETILKIQQLGELQGPGYAVKSLAIAYDWGYDYFANNNRIDRSDIETALKDWGEWFTSTGRYYGSLFSNHAPWGAKSIAYIAAALADEKLFYGAETKTQQSIVPQAADSVLSTQVNISAKRYFDQILHAVSFVASPRGGWHESVSYYLTKELPELIEFAEIICTYHDDASYTASVYTSPLFKYAGLFLLQMTTPDGMLQKIGDTGAKTALPAEMYRPGGNTYGDINNVGAGYIAGYFLERLCHHLRNVSAIESAQILQYYIDNFCFDFQQEPIKESRINLLYAIMWREHETTASYMDDSLLDKLSVPNSSYFDNVGILISKSTNIYNRFSTIVRFDAQPFYFSGHQHFAAGNFTIFKGANLAIDGGRYITANQPDVKVYHEKVYRQSLSHNVVLLGDSLVGQKSFRNKPNLAPYTEQQLKPFQEYGTGPQNISTFRSEQYKNTWNCPWQLSGMRLQLAKLYDHAGVDSYFRTMLHISHPPQPSLLWSDFIVIFDAISLQQPNTSHWQLHFRDNGANLSYGDSVFVIVRDESIDSTLVKSNFGSRYAGQLFIKACNPGMTPSVTSFDFPDSICQNCWNGRIWEESTHILRYTSPANPYHNYVNILAPAQFPVVTPEHVREFSQNMRQFDTENRFFRSLQLIISEKDSRKEPEALYLNVANPHQPDQQEVIFQATTLLQGWFFVIGIQPGTWLLRVASTNGRVLFTQRASTFDSYPIARWGILAFKFEAKFDDARGYSIILNRI